MVLFAFFVAPVLALGGTDFLDVGLAEATFLDVPAFFADGLGSFVVAARALGPF